jgi:hypothetical protein
LLEEELPQPESSAAARRDAGTRRAASGTRRSMG